MKQVALVGTDFDQLITKIGYQRLKRRKKYVTLLLTNRSVKV